MVHTLTACQIRHMITLMVTPTTPHERRSITRRASKVRARVSVYARDSQARIEVAAYENLALLCWNRARKARFISGKDALALYERNWRLVDQQNIKPAERELIERLKARYGNGVLNV